MKLRFFAERARESKAVDANGTRFHLLLGERDWGVCRDARDNRTLLRDHCQRAPVVCGSADDSGGFGWDAAA